MKRFTFTLVGLVAITLGLNAGIYAHHSAAGVDQTKQVTVEGTVKQFKWANPHSWVEVEVPNGKGGSDLWNFEMTSPTFLVQAGWKATTLKAGDKVKVTCNPMKNGDPGGLFVSVVLPTGQTLSQRGGARGPAPAPGAAAPPRGAAPGGAAPRGAAPGGGN
jgi:hypothetical protein